MKLVFACLLFAYFNVSAKSQTIRDWFNYFGQQNIQIIYSSDYLPESVTTKLINLESLSIVDFNHALAAHSLTLINIDEGIYVVNSIQHKPTPITGLIIRLTDHDSTPINSFTINTLSSSNGFVLLNNLNSKNINLTISASGYISVQKSIVLIKDNYKSVTFALEAKPISIDKIIVTASQVNFQSPTSSKNSFLREDLENTVSLGNDPIRATQRIAGNTSTGISGKTRTRGGNENESLIVLDNHILRNPFHFQNFFSLFSTINLSTIDGLDFYSGVFPIQYGGRLSSVLDIKTSDNYSQPKHEVGFDLINSYYTYRHSNDDYSQQYLASIRTGGQLINDHVVKNNIIQPEFDDAYFKASQALSDNWHTSQHLLFSRDEITIEDIDDEGSGEMAVAGHHDQDLWMQVNYDNLNNMQADLQFYVTRKHNTRIGNISNDNSIASLREDILTQYYGLKYNQTYNLRDNISLNYGFDVHQEDTDINRSRNIHHFGELVEQLDLQHQSQLNYNFENQGLAIDTFFNTRYQFNHKLIFDIGLRFEKKQWISENVTSPRFNMSYFYNDSTTLRFALGRHQQSQYIDELLLEDEMPDYFDPTSADIAIFEFNKTFSQHLNLRAEIYYKKYSSTQPYYENLFNGLHVLPDLFYDRIRVTPDDSKATGAEFTLNGSNQYFRWSGSYIFSDVDDIIGDTEVARSWDQHNALKFNLHMPLNIKYLKDWQLDLSANYHSGWAKTDIAENAEGIEIGLRNNSIFEDFYQFDIKLSKQITTHSGLLKFAIQANNLLDTDNSCCVNYKFENGSLQSEQKSWLSITPNLSVVYSWE